MNKPAFSLGLFLNILFLLAVSPNSARAVVLTEIEQTGPNGADITIQPVSVKGSYTGFNVFSNGTLIAPVRFCSLNLIQARNAVVSTSASSSTIQFTSLVASSQCGLNLYPGSIIVNLRSGHYPEVSFQIHIKSFDPQQWKSTIGSQPFHFLTLALPHAVVWQQGGWLNATPYSDLFPLLLDRHEGTPEISAYHYNREWSDTPPISGLPLPVIGLWNPQNKTYVAWDFERNRVSSHPDTNLAAGFCNRLILPRSSTTTQSASAILPATDGLSINPEAPFASLSPSQQASEEADRNSTSGFIAMVYPYGGNDYQQCIYPQSGDDIRDSATLDFSTNLGPEKDPNRLLWRRWWNSPYIHSHLPQAPATVNMGFLGAQAHLSTIPPCTTGPFIGDIGSFGVPGTTEVNGFQRQDDSEVMVAAANHDKAALDALSKEASRLASMATHFVVNGKQCAAWRLPLTGRWKAAWGGEPVATLHGAATWTAARFLLDIAEADGQKQYLPLVQECLEWAKYVVWTRDEFPDVPSSPFAIGSTPIISFLLDYYTTFRLDPVNGLAAKLALNLSKSFVYRYMPMWTGDSIRTDRLNSAFLWSPNSGRDWMGAACSNEVVWDLDTLAQDAVMTGDTRMMWALNGALSRWHRLYQAVYHHKVNDYQLNDFAEGYGLAPGNPYGYPGGRAAFGFGAQFTLIDPVGDSPVRVLAGLHGAMAFDRGTDSINLADYRCQDENTFSFRLKGIIGKPDVTLTAPYSDIAHEKIWLSNGLMRTQADVTASNKSVWTVIIHNVGSGDTVFVGSTDISPKEVVHILVPHTVGEELPADACFPYQTVALPTNSPVSTGWRVQDYAGLQGGLHWFWSVPFVLSSPVASATGNFLLSRPQNGMSVVCLLYTPAKNDEIPAPFLDDGSPCRLLWGQPSLAWRGWPEAVTTRMLMVSYKIPDGHTLVGINCNGCRLFAVSVLPNKETASEQELLTTLPIGAAEWESILQQEKQQQRLNQLAAELPAGKVAIMPPLNTNSPAYSLFAESNMVDKMTVLSQSDLLNPAVLTPTRYPVLVYVDGEDYPRTPNCPDDIAASLKSYLSAGGNLLLLSHLPFPMFYDVTWQGIEQVPHPVLPLLGLPLYGSLEGSPPAGTTMELIPGENVLGDVPASFAYPPGDPRLRSVDTTHLLPGADYQPIYKVVAPGDASYGDAAALLSYPVNAHGTRGHILYISAKLTNDPIHGPAILEAALRWMVSTANNLSGDKRK